MALIDLKLPDMPGTEVLAGIKGISSNTEAIIITGHASLDTAVQAMQDGAFSYVTKPIDMDYLLALMDKALEKQKLQMAHRKAEEALRKYRDHLEDLVNERTVQLKIINQRLEQEIADHKRSEQKAELAYTELNQIFNAAGDGMCVIDREFKIFRVNEVFCSFFGLKRDEAVGKNCFEIFQHHLCHTPDCPLARILSGEEQFETEMECENGIKRIFLLTAAPLHKPNGELIGVVENLKDISERKRMEQELLRIQKLESTGILAGGIAHDFNNLLTAIIGNLSLLELYAKSGRGIFEVLEETKKASQQTKHLTQQLITFAKGGLPIRKNVFVSQLLKDAVSFTLSGSRIRCEPAIADDLWWAELDAGQIHQALSNLIINADQAMPQGGIIKVSAENVMVKPETNLPLEEGRYIKISVKDKGIGIPKEDLPKVFDPYFTTKQKGSGLGLAITYSIIKKHGGYITLGSEVGVGTTFTIFLPALEKEIFVPKEVVEERLYTGKGRILLMDDQPGVRDTTGQMLNYLGYEVEVAKDGQEAIELYQKKKESGLGFDALILDLTVPGGMGGEEAVRKLHEIDPEVKAIVSSGYSNDPVISDFKRYGFNGVVAKPYEIKELSEVLDKVIK